LIPSPVLTLLLIGATLGGCSGGDFGRTRQDFVSDDMHRWIGEEATGSVGLHPSQFQLTDTERQLRDLAYQMIEPPRSRPAWKSVFGDYATIASPWRHRPVFDRTTYGRQLIDEPHRSHASRYAQLMDDVRDDMSGGSNRFSPPPPACSTSTASATPVSRIFPNCRHASAPTRSPAWKRTP